MLSVVKYFQKICNLFDFFFVYISEKQKHKGGYFMKTLAKYAFLISVIGIVLSFVSCGEAGRGDAYYSPSGEGDDYASAPEFGDSESVEGELVEKDENSEFSENVILPSGMITAAAWNDNDNYSDWLDLFLQGDGVESECGKFFGYTKEGYTRGFNSFDRVKVYVGCGESPVAGAKVVASDEKGNALFSAISDAQGNAYLFPGTDSGKITVTSGDGISETTFTKDARELSVDLSDSADKLNVIEIMLLVDVTGSMGDEIFFLKGELRDVINRIAANNSDTKIKLAMLFYRDTDDAVPFDYYDFTEVTAEAGLAAQQAALERQYAVGGGDYPEAVDEALELAVNKQWSTGSSTKIIFHVLDAPAHNGEKFEQKLVNATKTAAEKGIRICPIICSSADYDTEYTMRQAAVYTGGTFIFVTDDSGIGGAHHDPGLPNAVVELLNSLMVRVVNGYHTGTFEAPVYWKEDPNLAIKK